MRRNRRRTIADWIAGAVAVIVLGVGGLVVVKPAVDHWNDLYRGTPFETRVSTKRVGTQAARKRSVTTTTSQASSSTVERVLGKSGLLVIRLSLVMILAFLAAAVVQRVVLGRYGLRGAPAEAVVPAAPSQQAANGTLPESHEPEPEGLARNGPEGAQGPAPASLAPGIAKLVATRREALGLSQRELAKRAGVNHTVISRVESGGQAPSPRTLERLADALR